MTDMHTSDTSSMTQSPNPPQRDGYREQLSAMMDGALSADESRFLLRRMQHDAELAGCWERWQLFGDAMRGQTGTALPADFSRRVARAIADDARRAAPQGAESAPAAESAVAWRQRLRWGGGAALAASVAIAALISTRQPSMDAASGATPTVAAHAPTAIAPPPVVASDASAHARSVAPSAATVAGTASEIAAIAPDSIPKKMASIGSISSSAIPATAPLALASAPVRAHRGTRATVRSFDERAGSAAASATLAASLANDGVATAANDPFGRPARDIVAKPWPRALLPEAAVSPTGGMTVDYSVGPGLHPSFQPRRAADGASSGDIAAPSGDAPAP